MAGRKPAGADQLPPDPSTDPDPAAEDERDALIGELRAQVSELEAQVDELTARVATLQGWIDAADTPPAADPPQRQTGHAAARRRGEPGREYTSIPVRGPAIRLVADASGIVTPATSEEIRFADELRLPVIPDSQE